MRYKKNSGRLSFDEEDEQYEPYEPYEQDELDYGESSWSQSGDTYDWDEDDLYDARSENNSVRYARRRGKSGKLLAAVLLLALVAAGTFTAFRLGRGAGPERSAPLPEATGQTRAQGLAGFDEAGENGQELLYCRNLLNDDEKLIYDAICKAIEGHQAQAEDLHAQNENQIFQIFTYVQADHPEYFWIKGSSRISYHETEDGINAKLSFDYNMDEDERRQKQRQIDGIREQITQQFGHLSEYERVKGVYEYLIDNSIYDYGWMEQSICPVMLEGRGVCTSYAKSTQYLLQQMGVQALLVNGGNHAWNIVRIDGEYYQLDTTWGDPITSDGAQVKRFDYFCLTSREMFMNHTPSGEVPIPECTARDNNYFVKEGRFTSSYDESWLAGLLYRDISSGQDVSFRCSDEEVLGEYCRRMFEEDRIYDLLQEQGLWDGDQSSISYIINDSLYIIRISKASG